MRNPDSTNQRRGWHALRPISWLENLLQNLRPKTNKLSHSPLERDVEDSQKNLPKIAPSHIALAPAAPFATRLSTETLPEKKSAPEYGSDAPYHKQENRAEPYLAGKSMSYTPGTISTSELRLGSDVSTYVATKKALEGSDAARVAKRRAKAGSNDFLDSVEEVKTEEEKKHGQFLYDQSKKQE